MSGRAWVFGDNIDTDILAPGAYMKGGLGELATHCLESENPGFAVSVKPGDMIVAGRNFGMGSSREQAAQVLVHLGIHAVLAVSFAGIFYRNAFNLGLWALVCPDATTIAANDMLEIDPIQGAILNKTQGVSLACEAVPQHLSMVVSAGGLIPYLKQTLGKKQ